MLAGQPVEVRLEAAAPVTVHGARGPLRQVVLNLVTNAVRFTEAGRITLRVRRARRPDFPGEVAVLEVADTGIGIAADDLPRVFDRFFRGDPARGAEGGTGLGLAIARLIVEQHGGVIEVESEAGRGSVFRVLLPVEHARPAAGEAVGAG
jgi:signal transduction histidine kinase